jgi:hypothetical protein
MPALSDARRNLMRRLLLALITAANLFYAPVAFAAPTCQDIHGVTMRCGSAGAMPVGWTATSVEQASQDDWVAPVEPRQFLKVICVLGIYFCLLAMLPDFEGWREEEQR